MQKTAKNAIFTRGASAIDLWGVGKDGTTLHVIELKCGDNKGMGVISETLFYAGILYDTCIRADDLFQFGTYRGTLETSDKRAIMNNGKKFRRLAVHVLAEKYHPLFSEAVVQLIRQGFSTFPVDFDRAGYNFEEKVITP